MRVLGIETSCDETAAAVVDDGRRVLSSIVSSQVELHAPYGGVVPEVAGRAHVERIGPVVGRALEIAGVAPGDLGAVAVTRGPGLVGSLLVGVSTAKALALGWRLPLVGVNHLEAHLFANLLEAPDLPLPLVVLLVSGGHTIVVLVEAPGAYRVLGETLDDAAGEAFDKVARYLGLSFPGGPAIEAAAGEGDPEALALPRALLGTGYDLSFSGVKTAVMRAVEADPQAATADVAASFQEAVVEVLVDKGRRAVAAYGARGLCLAGGVAANGPLRQRVEEACRAEGVACYLPSRHMCTDNAAMVAAAGNFRLARDGPSSWSLGAEPGERLPSDGAAAPPPVARGATNS